MMEIHYAHLCEKAFLSQNGNLNLIGIFETVASKQVPVSFPQLSIVTALKAEAGKHQMTIKIIHIESKEEMIKSIVFNMDVPEGKEKDENKKKNLRIIGDINNLVLKEYGAYEVQIFLNDEQAYTIPFAVVEPLKPIPKGR